MLAALADLSGQSFLQRLIVLGGETRRWFLVTSKWWAGLPQASALVPVWGAKILVFVHHSH